MVNINEIKIFVGKLNDGNYIPSSDLFEVYSLDVYGNFIGLSIDNNLVRDEVDSFNYTTYTLDELNDIDLIYDSKIKEIIEYSGINMDIDGILDAISANSNPVRELYLKSVLYFKTTHLNKSINEFNLRVKCYAEFSNDFSRDIVSAKIIDTEANTLISDITIKTYLSEEEMLNKFSNYLL